MRGSMLDMRRSFDRIGPWIRVQLAKTQCAGAVGACDGRMWETVEDRNYSALEHWTSCVFVEGRNANLLSALGIR